MAASSLPARVHNIEEVGPSYSINPARVVPACPQVESVDVAADVERFWLQKI
jgi:hypothetical protein